VCLLEGMGDADIQKLGDGVLERAESLFRSSSVINFFTTYMSCRFNCTDSLCIESCAVCAVTE